MRDPLTDMYNSLGIGAGKTHIHAAGGRNMKIQPAVKKETGHIACWSGAGTVLMIVAFAICHKLFPEAVPFDYKVLIGDEHAYKSMKISYRYRSMAQLLWIVLAMVLPFVNAAAGIIPLFFPSLSIKLINILGIIKAKPNL